MMRSISVVMVSMVMVSMGIVPLITNCSSEVPIIPERTPDPTNTTTTVYPNSDDSELAPLVTFTDGLPEGTTNERSFTIKIKGNENTDSYQWAVVDVSDCANPTYSAKQSFPDNKQAEFNIDLEATTEDINRTLCVIGSNKDSTSEPTRHSWQQSPPPAVQTPTVTPSQPAVQTPTVTPSQPAVQTPTVTPTAS